MQIFVNKYLYNKRGNLNQGFLKPNEVVLYTIFILYLID